MQVAKGGGVTQAAAIKMCSNIHGVENGKRPRVVAAESPGLISLMA